MPRKLNYQNDIDPETMYWIGRCKLRLCVACIICMVTTIGGGVAALSVTELETKPDSKANNDSPKTPMESGNSNGDLLWWMKHPIYQVYPRSFKDSDGDGVGDLKGITEQLWYFDWLGIKAIWLNPIYESPMVDFGYDVSNYTAIDSIFGTMEDFDELVHEVHKRDMYLVMDFVPNHSSDQHPWFQASNTSDPNEYSDFYIWRNDSNNSVPNNWLSVDDTTGWDWSDSRDQYYYHVFLKQQPDLNYRNPKVVKQMQDVISFWLDKGVDGFRIDAIIYAAEDDRFLDEPRVPDFHGNRTDFNSLEHIYTQDQDLTFKVVSGWSSLMRSFEKTHSGKHIFACVEANGDDDIISRYYETGVSFPFNFNLIPWDNGTNVTTLESWIHTWMSSLPDGKWPNWVLGNHDNHRIATRLGGSEYIDIANMLVLLLPGTPTVYYGDELGMVDTFVPLNETVDTQGLVKGLKYSRDPERTPMQWNGTAHNAGFSNTTDRTWLPINDNYKTINVAAERADNTSHLNIFRSLLKLRQMEEFMCAGKNMRTIPDSHDPNILSFFRWCEKSEDDSRHYSVHMNVAPTGDAASSSLELDVMAQSMSTDRSKGSMPKIESANPEAEVVVKSRNIPDSQYRIGQKLINVTLGPAQGIVLQWSSNSNVALGKQGASAVLAAVIGTIQIVLFLHY